MTVRRSRAVVTWLPAFSLLALVLLSPGLPGLHVGASAKTIAGSLDVTPRNFYAGQAVAFEGDLGSPGRRQIWLEFHMNRPGDSWTRIEPSTTYSASDGTFSFRYPARGMLNISMRVSSSEIATPSVLFQAHDQELALSVEGAVPGTFTEYLAYRARAGRPFVVLVDTSPPTPNGVDSPILVGRTITLQQRVGAGTWQDVGTASVDSQGFADFELLVPDPGTVVYRARAEAWTADGSTVGWFPSFPTTVEVKP
ncbi:MAG TPA: hypothetical protein VFK41_00445 [Nocardioidaceae bacterium]|nr:hypothetical protein [Nocardioidaceae bacterium]